MPYNAGFRDSRPPLSLRAYPANGGAMSEKTPESDGGSPDAAEWLRAALDVVWASLPEPAKRNRVPFLPATNSASPPDAPKS